MDENIKEYEYEIKEELKRMTEAISSLDETQRKEYLRKQYETFLKEINTIELLQKIKIFRKLDISSMDEIEISKELETVLMWDRRFVFQPNLGNYPKSTIFFV